MQTLVAAAAAVSTLLAAGAPATKAVAKGPSDVKTIDATLLPKGVTAKGAKVEQVWTWTESDGKTLGYAVFSSTEKMEGDRIRDRNLYVQLLRGPAGALKELRLVQDGTTDCADADLSADFLEDSVRVTDEDGDGKAELSFAYDLNCTTDVSPSTRKLLVLEQGDKHILRGTARVQVGESETAGGEFKAEGFKGQPKIDAFAKARWAVLLEPKAGE